MKWKSFVFLMALAIAVILQPLVANASSIYDDAYTTASRLIVSDGSASCPVTDVSYSWKSYITDSSTWKNGPTDAAMISIKEQFEDALDSGSVAVSQSTNGWSPYGGSVNILFSPNSELSLSWSASQVAALAPQGTLYRVGLTCSSSNSPHIEYSYTNSLPAGQIPPNNAMPVTQTPDGMAIFDEMKNAIYTGDPNYPSGYAGSAVQTEVPKAEYVAMGDSFSSGEGNPAFEVGTDEDGGNKCHRSSQAYPRLLQNDSSLNLGATNFVACSGATTSDVLYGGVGSGNWSEGPQIDALSEDTQAVTITIGGNDVGFIDFATACTTGLCNFSTSAYSAIVGKITNNLPSSLDGTFEKILSLVPSSAEVYVVGYPHIAPELMPTGPNSACFPLNGQADNPDPTLNDGATVRYVVDLLNSTISDSVDTANDVRLTFIDLNQVGSLFEGHDWCEQDRYFETVIVNQIEYSFHPTNDGHSAYKSIIKDVVD